MDKPEIICIDDQREVLAAMTRDLESLRPMVEITACESADEAGEVLEELEAEGKPVALLICDHIMPGQNGIDFLIDVAADPGRFPHLKKILLTGLATHQDTITAINRAAIDRYLEKPWERETLLEAVRALLTEFIMRSGMDPEPFQAIFDTPTYLREARRRGGV